MSRFHIEPMVYDHVDKLGIWWKSSKNGQFYIFYWNPLKWLHILFFEDCFFGFLPFRTKHLR